jgi:hypothetical protein
MAGIESRTPSAATEESIIREESLDPDQSTLVDPRSDEKLSAGLSNDSRENARRASAFWEMVWPKLREIGWETRVRKQPLLDLIKL